MIAVVGGRGVIGSAIVDILRTSGHHVIIVTHDRQQGNLSGFRYADVLRLETLGAALQGADVVVQSVNFPTYPIERPHQGHTFMNFDGLGTERLIAAAEAGQARMYIYISGVGPSADSTKSYYQAIWRGEQAVLKSRLQGICIRPTLVYGPRDRSLNRILKFASMFPVIPVIGDGQQQHQPVYAGDVAEVVRLAIQGPAARGVYEVGGPDRLTLDDMLKMLFRLAGLRRTLLHIPAKLARAGGTLLQNLPSPPLTAVAVDFMASDFVADLRSLERGFDLKLTAFEEGLRKSLSLRSAFLP